MSEVKKVKKDLNVSREIEIVEGRKTGVLLVTIDDTIYRVNYHEGEEAFETAMLVNKIMSPRSLRLEELRDQMNVDPDLKKKLEALEKENPAEAEKLKAETASENRPFTRALAEAWEGCDPKLETAMTREVLKYTSGPFGSLNNDNNFKKTFRGPSLLHIRPLRAEVVEYNRFFDLIDSIM
jgi:glutamyl-tRNA reductase